MDTDIPGGGMVMTEPRPYLTFGEAQMYSRIPRRTLRELLSNGQIPSRRFSGKIVIAKAALDRYLTEAPELPESVLRRFAPVR